MMMVQIAQATLAVLSGLALLVAAPAAIGIAISSGAILLNNARTAGNATVFEGALLQTQAETSQVDLTGGSRVRFAANSRGRFFGDHVDLDMGSAQIRGFSAHANGLTVRADGTASVSLEGKAVEVVALRGNVRVFNASGINVANLLPGDALDLRTQGAGTAVSVTTTRISPQATKSDSDCMMRRGRPCRTPSPTGSSSQPSQLSGGK
jgi:ferric-dicitrate binding protein FerR (iron transport regulator)